MVSRRKSGELIPILNNENKNIEKLLNFFY